MKKETERKIHRVIGGDGMRDRDKKREKREETTRQEREQRKEETEQKTNVT